MEKIFLQGMKYLCKIGCTAEERAFPQTLLMDLRLSVDLTELLNTGDLSKGVCWEAVNSALASECARQEWILVEELAESILQLIFSRFDRVNAIELKIGKNVFTHGGLVGVEISRERT